MIPNGGMEKELTNLDLLHAIESVQESLHEVIQEFATHADERFDRVDRRMTKIEATMVTKDYLDNKLADESLHYGGNIRKTNERIDLLTDALVAERSLSPKAARAVAVASPYARRH